MLFFRVSSPFLPRVVGSLSSPQLAFLHFATQLLFFSERDHRRTTSGVLLFRDILPPFLVLRAYV